MTPANNEHPNHTVPRDVAACPECGGTLEVVDIYEWRAETGVPVEGGYAVECENNQTVTHRYWQSDWQGTLNMVHAWLVLEYAVEEN